MSKKHKRRQQFNQFNQQSAQAGQPAGSPAAAGYSGGSMSGELTAEYRIIRHDLLRVFIVNVIFLAAVLTLYYTNLHSGYLEKAFGKILHF